MIRSILCSVLALSGATTELWVPEVSTLLVQDDDPIEVNIDWLTSVDYRPGMKLPDEILALDGKQVQLVGYMAIGTLEGDESFEFVPESCECGRSKVQHFIDVTLTDDVATFTPGRITLVGKFSVGEVKEDGFVTSLYRLEVERLP
ncbi:MAG TPA: hypothetical protein EYQ25_07720 [Planctomycetes bacterium]|nr:hypothetical protein [Planctomycetota bacterium]HIL36676.1 hypothetical protein [Planctomycetota bacterium]